MDLKFQAARKLRAAERGCVFLLGIFKTVHGFFFLSEETFQPQISWRGLSILQGVETISLQWKFILLNS